MDLEFDIKKLDNLVNNLKDICIECDLYNKFCQKCSINNSLREISIIINKNIHHLVDYFDNNNLSIHDLTFDKNKIFLIQNNLEEICSDCNYIGIYCKKCNIHKIKREIASLPVENISIKFEVSSKKIKSSCGSSCSSSCSTKKIKV
ncbi:MAG: hypothetical protein KatS3mg068_0866 [Candidatus Sericytochromatia bacterium]|nr:MAG: hypothetical protein KatS3mg068_0866 [Candidatus Sericytochromatia bacterium]